MNRFHSGSHSHGFSNLLRSMSKNKSIQMPANNLQAGAKPEHGGSTQRRPNDKATIKHMEAKDSAGRQPGGARISHGARRAMRTVPGHRIAEGPVGTDGRAIHHETDIERKHGVPGHHAIGANRSKFSKTRAGMFKGKSGMSPEVEDHEGVPGHQSVINRGIKPHGGFKHAKMPSRTRRMNLASKLNFHSSVH